VDAHVTSLFLIWLRSMHVALHSCNEEPFVDNVSFKKSNPKDALSFRSAINKQMDEHDFYHDHYSQRATTSILTILTTHVTIEMLPVNPRESNNQNEQPLVDCTAIHQYAE
jgi:hypothetical protein